MSGFGPATEAAFRAAARASQSTRDEAGWRVELERLMLAVEPTDAGPLGQLLRESRAAWLLLLPRPGAELAVDDQGPTALVVGRALAGTAPGLARLGWRVTLLDPGARGSAELELARARGRGTGAPVEIAAGVVRDPSELPPRAGFDLVLIEEGPGELEPALARFVARSRDLVAVTADNRLAYKSSTGDRADFHLTRPWTLVARLFQRDAARATLAGHRRRLARLMRSTAAEEPGERLAPAAPARLSKQDVRAAALYPDRRDYSHAISLDGPGPGLTIGPKERHNRLKLLGYRAGLFATFTPSFGLWARRSGGEPGPRQLDLLLAEAWRRFGGGGAAPEAEQLVATRGNTALVQTRGARGADRDRAPEPTSPSGDGPAPGDDRGPEAGCDGGAAPSREAEDGPGRRSSPWDSPGPGPAPGDDPGPEAGCDGGALDGAGGERPSSLAARSGSTSGRGTHGAWVLRVPLGHRAEAAARQNRAGLLWMREHFPEVPVPEPLGVLPGVAPGSRSSRDGQDSPHGIAVDVTVEERLDGLGAGQLTGDPAAMGRLTAECGALLAGMVTAPAAALDEAAFEELFGRRFDEVRSRAAVPATVAALDRLEEELRELALGLAVPRVATHTDLRPKHVVAQVEGAERGRVVGIVDWSALDPRGLPLYDLVHLIASERAQLPGSSTRRGWEEVQDPARLTPAERAALEAYERALDLPPTWRTIITRAYPVLFGAMAEAHWDYSRPRWLLRLFGIGAP